MIKCILCFSPVGSTLRVRSRKFPAIVNCTQIDWFHEWPQEALESVAFKFLVSVDYLPVITCLEIFTSIIFTGYVRVGTYTTYYVGLVQDIEVTRHVVTYTCNNFSYHLLNHKGRSTL